MTGLILDPADGRAAGARLARHSFGDYGHLNPPTSPYADILTEATDRAFRAAWDRIATAAEEAATVGLALENVTVEAIPGDLNSDTYRVRIVSRYRAVRVQ